MLRNQKLTPRRSTLLLIAATVLLVLPCLTAASWHVAVEIDRPESIPALAMRQDPQKQQLQEHEKAREELQRHMRELKENARLAPENQRPEIEGRMRELQRNLELHERMIQMQLKGANAHQIRDAEQRLKEILETYPGDSSQLADFKKKLAEVADAEKEFQRLLSEQSAGDKNRKAKLIYKVEPEYPEDARAKLIQGSVVLGVTIDHQGTPQDIQVKTSLDPSLDKAAIEAVRKWRFQPALKDGEPVSMWVTIEVNFSYESKRLKQQGDEMGEVRETRRLKEAGQGQDERELRRTALVQGAVISMDRAIQIATSQYPGKVLACSLGRDKDGPVFYHLVIVNTEGDKQTVKYVWVGADDGRILKTEDEARAPIFGGTLNGKAIDLPNPEYPEIARAAKAEGTVAVQVVVDEQGNVISAKAVLGHPLLRAASVSAARAARFSPTYLQGQPVKVTGTITYNFVMH